MYYAKFCFVGATGSSPVTLLMNNINSIRRESPGNKSLYEAKANKSIFRLMEIQQKIHVSGIVCVNEYGRPAGRRRDGVCRTGFRSDSGGGRVRRLNPDTLQGVDVIPRRFRGRPRSVSVFSAERSGCGVPGDDAGA